MALPNNFLAGNEITLVYFSYIESPALACRVAPYLTIGIPTWNREAALRQQLAALIPHLRSEVELIVIDNASTDGTWQVLLDLHGTITTPFRGIRNGVNLGADINYLRVIEAASGEWFWLIGDDDAIDFMVLQPLLLTLRKTNPSVLLLLEEHEKANWVAQHVDIENFFSQENDEIGLQLMQLGRAICRTAPTKPLLRSAYSKAVGNLHSYSFLYGPLIVQQGVDLLRLPLLKHSLTTPPRWNQLLGHLGAWESSLLAFGNWQKTANAREIRLRYAALLSIMTDLLKRGDRVDSATLFKLFCRFEYHGKFKLLALLMLFYVKSVFQPKAGRFKSETATPPPEKTENY